MGIDEFRWILNHFEEYEPLSINWYKVGVWTLIIAFGIYKGMSQ